MPLSCLFNVTSKFRKRRQQSRQMTFSVPVIVVGNITVGGTGKTPMVAHLVTELQARGFRVGVASRGYHGSINKPTLINHQHHASEVGDEPLLLFQQTHADIMVGPDRLEVIGALIERGAYDVLICDDGLQDYRFEHTVEIAMVDAERQFGNARLLPAGPLREPVTRVQWCDFVVTTGAPEANISHDHMQLKIDHACNMNVPDDKQPLTHWQGQKVHAVAAIANPQRFFNALRDAGLQVTPHAFPDHATFTHSELTFTDQKPVFMTAKDAVKCSQYTLDNTWYVPLQTQLPDDFMARLMACLKINSANYPGNTHG